MALSRAALASFLLSLLSSLVACERHQIVATLDRTDGGSATPFECRGLRTSPGDTRPDVPWPAYLGSYLDPIYGTKITRITGDPGAPIPATGGTWQRRTRGIASTKQAFNADESLLFLNFGGALLLDGRSYEVVGRLGLDETGTWHPRDPRVMIFVSGNAVFRWDARSNTRTEIASFPGYSAFEQWSHRDYLSADGTLTSVVATRDADGAAVGFVIDLGARTKRADVVLADHGFTDATDRSAIIAPSGRYLVLDGTRVTNGRRDETAAVIFDLDGRLLRPRAPCPVLGDQTLDADGDSGDVGRCEASGSLGARTSVFRHGDGLVRDLGPYSTFGSGRAFRRPGWYFAHTIDAPILFALRLEGGRVEYLADTRSVIPVDSWARPAASPSPSGTRVLFSTNWGTGPAYDDDDAHSFVVDFTDACRP